MNILVMVLLGTSLVILFVLFLKSNNEPSEESDNILELMKSPQIQMQVEQN